MDQSKGGWFWYLIAPYVSWGSVKDLNRLVLL